jgi:uncharacterized repeat protein (TIGR02543 family)
LKEPTKERARFDGWTADYANESLADVTTPATRLRIPSGATGNVKFTAHWTRILTVTFNANGGVVAEGNESRSVVEGATLAEGTTPETSMPPDPTRSGYVFAGCYTAEGVAFTADTPVTDDRAVWARWNLSGGDNGGGNGGGVTPETGDGETEGEDGTTDEGGESAGEIGDEAGETGDEGEEIAPGGTDPTKPPVPARPGGNLTPAPGAENAYIELDEDGVPLGEWRYDDDLGEWIFDEYPPPLGNLPQTGAASAGALSGGGSAAWPFLIFLCALLAALGFASLTANDRRADARRRRTR